MSKSLFDEFDAVSPKEWKQKIQVDLKGADYNDTLIWKTHEGIDVKPFYHLDDIKSLPEFSEQKQTHWKICETIQVIDASAANEEAKKALHLGAESIRFIVNSEDISVNALLQDIDTSNVTVFINTKWVSEEFIKGHRDVYFQYDIINNLSKSGNWLKSIQEDYKTLEAFVKKQNTLSTDLSIYQNAGASIIQQLAYGLTHINEYLNHFHTITDDKEKESLNIIFTISIGSNYFFEIAKIRALRQLWSSLASAYNINPVCTILTVPSTRNKTIYDYNVNMLRTTTECMSAILGGAEFVSNFAYDGLYHQRNEFGSRIARNQLLILKHESYFDKVENPADGSYYIETLTQQLAENALALFKDIEANGGFLKQLKAGIIQRKIKESASKEQADFESGQLVLLGTNKHPNPNDLMKNNLEISPFMKFEKRKTLIQPIIEKRISETMEISRLNNE